MLFLRLILFAVILAGAGVIAVSEMKVKPLLEDLKSKEKKVAADLAKEKDDHTKQKARAMAAEQERDAGKADVEAAKKAEDEAKKAADAERQKAVAAAQETNKAKQETEAIKVQSAEYFDLAKLGLNPPKIREIHEALPKATNELSLIKKEQGLAMVQLIKTKGELDSYQNPKGTVVLPAGLMGKVSAVDPKWDFVVLDIGANHGLLKNGEMTISRGGKLVARVKLAKVETDYAIANVMAGFKKSDVQEGDDILTPSPTVLPPRK